MDVVANVIPKIVVTSTIQMTGVVVVTSNTPSDPAKQDTPAAMSGARTIRLLLADVDETLLTKDKVLTGRRRKRPGSCATPALCSPSPAACAGERRYR